MGNLGAVGLDGASIELPEAAVAALGEALRGELLAPERPGYDEARRIWNAMVDKRPALIARCRGAADVIAAVNFARAHDLLLSVRGGGHNVAGNALCDGGLVVDLSAMRSVRVDPGARRALAEGGVTWREYDHETQAFGLASTGGLISTTGVAGLTLGGGLGWLKGLHGLACDNLLAVDLVTAEGALLRVSAEENADLFWGLRGGGGNFGVVTAFTFQLHPVGPEIVGGLVLHPFEAAREMFEFYRGFVEAGLPDELATTAVLTHAPDGAPIAAMGAAYLGPPAEAEAALDALRGFGAPIADTVGPIPYTGLQRMLDASFPAGFQNYWKSSNLRALAPGAVDVLVDRFADLPSAHTAVVIEQGGGAVARIPDEATAFAHRDVLYNLLILGIWPDAADNAANIAWVRGLHGAMAPFRAEGVYVNYLDRGEGEARIRAAYGPAKYARLAALKKKYDPRNRFRVNQNVPPGA